MTLNRGYKALAIVVVGLILIGLIIYFGFFFGRTPSPKETGNKTYNQNQTVPTQKVEYTPPPLTEADRLANELRVLSTTFAERFGTFSNQGDGQTITDLKPMMTDKFYNWAVTQYANKLQTEYSNNGEYAAVVTTANSVTVVANKDKSATVNVSTTRIKNLAGGKSLTTTENLKIDFVKVDTAWKVDGAYWSK